jgi:hypothetical protein
MSDIRLSIKDGYRHCDISIDFHSSQVITVEVMGGYVSGADVVNFKGEITLLELVGYLKHKEREV